MMRFKFFILLLLATLKLSAQQTTINNEWLLILSGFDNVEQAEQAKQNVAFETLILNSAEFDNLNPGWFINCIAFKSKQEAVSESKILLESGVNNYVKFSGKYKNHAHYLLENHFLIFGGHYLISEYKIQPTSITAVIGCDILEDTYIARASVSVEILPDELNYLIGKEIVVYARDGNRARAKIKGFEAVNISNPYWGFIQQWSEYNASTIEIANQLIENNELTLIAVLDLPEDFEGIISHIITEEAFQWSNDLNEGFIPQQAYDKINSLHYIKTCDTLLFNSIQQGESSYTINNLPIVKNAQAINSGDTTFVFINIVYGDYCEYQKFGCFYTNVFAVWNMNTDEIELIKLFEKSAQFDFTPLVVSSDKEPIIGFIVNKYDEASSYFKKAAWKKYKSIKIWTHDCD